RPAGADHRRRVLPQRQAARVPRRAAGPDPQGRRAQGGVVLKTRCGVPRSVFQTYLAHATVAGPPPGVSHLPPPPPPAPQAATSAWRHLCRTPRTPWRRRRLKRQPPHLRPLEVSPVAAASRRCFSRAVGGSLALGGSPPQPSASTASNPSEIVRNDIAADHA